MQVGKQMPHELKITKRRKKIWLKLVRYHHQLAFDPWLIRNKQSTTSRPELCALLCRIPSELPDPKESLAAPRDAHAQPAEHSHARRTAGFPAALKGI